MRSSASFIRLLARTATPDKNAESFFALSKTPLHSATTEEHGNAAFDAGAEALRLFEIRTFFKSLTLGRFLSAALGNAGAGDACFAAGLLVTGVIETAIGGEDFGKGTECFSVSLQRGFHLIFIAGISIQNAVLCDETLSAFGEEHFVAEFDRLVNLAALDQIRMRLKDRVEFF